MFANHMLDAMKQRLVAEGKVDIIVRVRPLNKREKEAVRPATK